MKPGVTIEAALNDGQLLGAALGDTATWGAWTAVLKAAFGLSLSRAERRAFAKVAGDRSPPSRRVAELWAIVGRRGGKSRMAALIAVYIAAFGDHEGKLARGEVGYVLVLAASLSQARAVFDYIRGFIAASPILSQLVQSETASEIRLRGNVVLAVHPNSFRTVRGKTLLACVFDECGFWRDESTASPDLETYRAVLPALATTGGPLIGISSPYRRAGLLHTRHRDHFGRDSDVLVVQGGTEAFNPTIDGRVIARARADDPESARAEWDAQFRADLAALLDDATIDAAIDRGRPLELPPREGISYVAFTDASAGRHDAFALCIGHKEDERFVADVVRGRKPPFDPASVAAEYAVLAKEYGVRTVVGDAFAGEWTSRAFRAAGVEYKRADMPKSGLYLEGVAPFMRGIVSIPDLPVLTRELRLLERRTSRSGRDAVDHPQGGSDDHANVLFGALRVALAPVARTFKLAAPEIIRGGPEDEFSSGDDLAFHRNAAGPELIYARPNRSLQ